MKAADMHIRLIDPTGQYAPVIHHHRVWDTHKFYRSQVKLHENAPNPADRRLVSIATEAEYRAARGRPA